MKLGRPALALVTLLAACAAPSEGERIVGDGEIAGEGGGSEGAPMAASEGTAGGSAASDSAGGSGGSGGSGSGGSGFGAPSAPSGASTSPDQQGQDMPPPPVRPVLEPGALTAGAWDDTKNFDAFTAFYNQIAQAQPPGRLPIPLAEHEASRARAAVSPHTTLDVQLVIDTTGSMGDEIRYLQREFDDLAATIAARYPQAAQRWSLVLYRDQTDDYVVRWFDFRDSPSAFRDKLATASAGGGGDLPEAPDRALEVAHKLSWRRDPQTARLLFWVADAPHHVGNEGRLANALRGARDAGIHVYPVAASGVDDLAEHAMRSAAQLTGGRYLFLTDDSGLGNRHAEPHVPCYFVTQLDRAILRMIDIEMTGRYREPEATEIVRTGGNPRNGACRTTTGETVEIY